MQSVRVIKRYAKAVLDYALEQNQAQQAYDELLELVQAIDHNADFKALLTSPIVKSGLKIAVLDEVFVKKSLVVQRFIELLSQNKRLSYLYAISREYCHLYRAYRGEIQAVVTTAEPISQAIERQVLDKVKHITGKEQVVLENVIDRDIIGGFILRVGDVQYNASVAYRISQVKKQLSQGVV